MDSDSLSRRQFISAFSAALGLAGVASWSEIAEAAHDAHAAAQSPASATFGVLSTTEAADIEALTAQIVPTDDLPGAREAGVVYFIDRGLGSFFSLLKPGFLDGLHEFQAACRAHFPAAPSFAALTNEQQIEFLQTVEKTPFFDRARLLTLCGLFSMPKYGGNRDGAGWKIIGFEDRHVFESPFGYYDRDYPGFVADAGKSS